MPNTAIQSIHGAVPFDIPALWQILTIAQFDHAARMEASSKIVTRALKAPIGALSLSRQLAAHHTVAIIIEDLTRSSPKKEILPVLLKELEAIGISPGNICIVIALGTHRALSRAELEAGYGADIVSSYRFINHDCHEPDLVEIGHLETGTPVKINRHVYEADFRIGVGSIFPHPLNGFGGGGKILFPGVADFESIFQHHLKYSFVGQADLGNTHGNEFCMEVNRLARIGKLDFIINSVLDHNDRLYDLVCGDPEKAHSAGTDICKNLISKRFSAPADITIISSFPYSEGPQIMKPLAPANLITRKGGIIILYADCTVPLPEIYFDGCEKFRSQHGSGLRRAVLDHFANDRPILANSPPELNMSLAQALLAQNDFQVILVTGDIARNDVQRLGFTFAKDMAQAIDIGATHFLRPRVNIVPSGGVILPVVDHLGQAAGDATRQRGIVKG